jgi:hypothetical protein
VKLWTAAVLVGAAAAVGVVAGCPADDPPLSPLLTQEAGPKPDSSVNTDGAVVLPDGAVVLPDGAIVDATPPDDAAPCTSLVSPPADPQCASCLLANCCDPTNTCFSDPQCVALAACAKGCKADAANGGDKPCLSACFKKYPTVVDPFAAYDDCHIKSCAKQCP